jgi:hypothetical protein
MKAAAVWAYGYAYAIEAHQIVQRQVWSIVSDARYWIITKRTNLRREVPSYACVLKNGINANRR